MRPLPDEDIAGAEAAGTTLETDSTGLVRPGSGARGGPLPALLHLLINRREAFSTSSFNTI